MSQFPTEYDRWCPHGMARPERHADGSQLESAFDTRGSESPSGRPSNSHAQPSHARPATSPCDGEVVSSLHSHAISLADRGFTSRDHSETPQGPSKGNGFTVLGAPKHPCDVRATNPLNCDLWTRYLSNNRELIDMPQVRHSFSLLLR